MPNLPSGTVTFLFTDIEDSTSLWECAPEQMKQAHTRHCALILACVERFHGHLIRERGEGDSTFSVFESAADAVAACCDLQRVLLSEPWPADAIIRVRAGLHTGTASVHDNDYNASDVNRCARIRSLAYGGQSLVSQTVYDLTRDLLPSGVSAQELGSFPLRGLKRPEKIYQLHHPDLPSTFPPLRTPDVRMPIQLTRFIGREREVAEIKGLLKAHRLLTLTGPGGSGKTRLTLQTAAELLDDYPDGVRLVELAPLAAEESSLPFMSNAAVERVAQAFAVSLSVKEAAGQTLPERIESELLSKSLLLVVDNCEHLRSSCAWLIEKLLRACPGLNVLANSREALSIPAEQDYELLPLPTPDIQALPSFEQLQHNEAMQLFEERAQSVSPGFRLTPENAPTVARICSRLDGLPFAIELVAARIRMFSVKQIDANLPRLLTSASPTQEARHQTMQTLIDWSYDRLTPAAQTLLRRLAVFSGSWTLDAAGMVCSGSGLAEEEVFDLLERLRIASMVKVEPHEEEYRYRLLETMRMYALKRLQEANEEIAVQDRHHDYFLNLAEEAEPYLTRAEQKEWLDRLTLEHDNLRAALKVAVDGEKRLRLAGALWRYWEMRSFFTEGRAWLEGTLASGRTVAAPVRAKALNGLGVLLLRLNETEVARQRLEECLSIYTEQNDLRGIAGALNNLGTLAQGQGDLSAAVNYHTRSLELHQQIDDRWGSAASFNNLGMIARNQGDLEQAQSYYEQSRVIYRELGETAKYAAVTHNLGEFANVRKDYARARPLLEEALEIFRVMGNPKNIAIALHNLSITITKLSGLAVAYPLWRESMALRLELKDEGGLHYSFISLAYFALQSKQLTCAAILYAAATVGGEASATPFSTQEEEEISQNISLIQRRIGAKAFRSAWSQGSSMTPMAAVAYALEHLERIDD